MKEIITSRQNPKIKAAIALCDKKGRRRSGQFRFDGIKLFLDSLGHVEICTVFVREPVSESVAAALERAAELYALREDQVTYVSESVFEKLTAELSPEGIVTVARMPRELHTECGAEDIDALSFSGERLLLVESLRDTGNLGTIMRSCAALGIDRLIMSDDCADLYNPKTVRSAMGALFRLPTLTVEAEEMPRLIGRIREEGRRVFAAALCEDAVRIGSFDLLAGDCFVIGNEGHGLSAEVINACDGRAIIPMVEGNESLNAAAAAVICIWETVRADV